MHLDITDRMNERHSATTERLGAAKQYGCTAWKNHNNPTMQNCEDRLHFSAKRPKTSPRTVSERIETILGTDWLGPVDSNRDNETVQNRQRLFEMDIRKTVRPVLFR